ncbi:MAG TPA: class I SAM-dependent methyltransferase [Bryobacteraceae bacterium]|jgi:SAM-dependent methyltransferase
MRSLDVLASRFHDHLKSVKSRTALEGADWYPWRSLSAMQMLDRELGVDLDALQKMIGPNPVLDLGCGDGDVAFFLESLGLGEKGVRVDAVDHAPTNYNRMEGVRALKRALGSHVGIHSADLDTRPNLPGSDYGLAIMLGVLYHLKNPYLALETLARSSRNLYLSTRIASLTPDRTLNFGAFPLAYLVDDRELNNDPTNFWIFSEESLKRIVRRSGWNILKYSTLGRAAATADPVSEQGDVRAFLLAESRLAGPGQGFHLDRGWHELEHGASRWTQRRFSVQIELAEALRPATLRFLFHLPEALVERRPQTRLRASVNGLPLPQAEFSTPGEHEYSATLPGVPAGVAVVEFELDAATGPTDADERELGVMVYFSGAPAIRLG